MGFSHISKGTLLRATALVSATGASLLAASPALAITASAQPPALTTESGNSCTIRGDFRTVGVVDDGNGRDQFVVRLRNTTTGSFIGQTVSTSTVVGQTRFVTPAISATLVAPNRGIYELQLFESDGTNVGTTPLAVMGVDRVRLNRGACEFLAPSTLQAEAGPDQNVTVNDLVTLDAIGSSDPDGDTFTATWTQIAGPAVALSSTTDAQPTFTAPSVTAPTQVQFRLDLVDDYRVTASDIVTITIAPPANTAPVVDAGTAQTVDGGATVSLTGTANDNDNDPLTYEWVQVGGPTVTLADATTLNASFTAPPRAFSDQDLLFELRVNDGTVTVADEVRVTVRGNQAPTAAIAAPTSADSGQTILLNGRGSSDPENDPLIYQWTQIGGPQVSLTNANSDVASFVVPQAGANQQVYEFQLLVADSFDATDTATVSITQAANGSPVADAGADQTVRGEAQVALDGSASSDPDGDPLTYLWEQVSGPAVTLSATDIVNPTFTAPAASNADQVLEFRLTVRDRAQQVNGRVFIDPFADSDTVVITIAANRPPQADAGPDQSVTGGSQVTLDGSGSSDPDDDTLIYEWAQLSGPAVTLSATDIANPTFTAPATINQDQQLEFQLTARDRASGQVIRTAVDPNTSTDTVLVTVLANRPPEADAGDDQTVAGGAQVTLDGSGSSDPDGDTLIYEWVQVSGPTVTLSASDVVNPSFAAPASTGQAQQLEFRLTVRDREQQANARVTVDPNSDSDTVVITIEANRPPLADAGAPQGPINGGETVTLNGSASTDPDGDTLTYAWTQLSGTPVTLSDASSANPTFVAPNSTETLVFSLTVSDGQSTSAAATVEVGVQAVGSITIVQQVSGPDTTVGFTSTLGELNTSIVTSGGTGQIVIDNVATGSYLVTAEDLKAQGYAVTGISCNDSDSTGDIASRTATIQLAAGEDVTCTFTTVNSRAAALEAIHTFLTGRNALILAHQPDLQRRLDRLTGNGATGGSGMVNAYGVPLPGSEHLPLQATLTREGAQLSSSLGLAGLAGGNTVDLWVEAHFSRARIGQQDANFSIVHIGADVKLGDDLLLGALVQIDDFGDRDQLEAGEAEGSGWLAGPYVMARLAPSLYAEVRAAWGTSDNRVSPLDGMVDAFDTSRSLYSGSLVGDLDLGPATRFRPELTLRYLSENQKAYTDSLGVAIPGQSVEQGDISFRPRISHTVALDDDWSIRPFVEVEGIYTFGTDPDAVLANLLPANYAAVVDDLRARVEGGFDLFGNQTFRASLSGFYDGIGADRFSDRGVRIGVSFGF